MRYEKVKDELIKCPIMVNVKVTERLTQVCREYLEKDRVFRVVGWLEMEPIDKRPYVLAEHVECKPKVVEEEKR